MVMYGIEMELKTDGAIDGNEFESGIIRRGVVGSAIERMGRGRSAVLYSRGYTSLLSVTIRG